MARNLCKALQVGLVGWWDSAGKDLSGNGNHGTLVNSPTKVRRLQNDGLDFGSSNTTKIMYNSTNLGINGGAVTLSVWAKLNSNQTPAINDHAMVIGEFSGTPNWIVNGIGFNLTNTAVVFSRLRTQLAWSDASYTYSPGTTNYHHYVYTYDGTNIRGYIDGVLVVTLAASGNGITEIRTVGPFVCGSDYAGSTSNQCSAITINPMVYNRALSATEIQLLHKATFIK